MNDVCNLWCAETGKSLNFDDILRCLIECPIECESLGADYKLIIDETIGRVKERIEREPRSVGNPLGLFRISVRRNAEERLRA